MTAVPHRRHSRPLAAGLVCLAILAITGWLAPAVALRGWLIGFVSVGAIALGSAAWLAIHGLTRGRWGDAARPSFLFAASGLPVLIAALLPLLLGAPALYRWAVDPQAAGPGVAALDLNPISIGLRSLVLLGALWWFTRSLGRGAAGTLAAAVTLLVYAVLMNLLAFGWLLSLDPRFNSSAFGMQIIVLQLVAGLCFAILTLDAAPDDRAWGDLAALLFACLLGEAYLILMTFIIDWYGDLPEQAAWFLRRSRNGWAWVEGLGTVGGAIGPMVALLFGRVRHDPAWLRIVAAAVLLGVVVETVWLVAPGTGPGLDGWAALAGLVACLALGGLLWALAARDAEPVGLAMQRRAADGA